MVVNTTTAGSGSQSSLREANASRVVETIRHFGSITQVELAAATGLSQATVSNIVKSLSQSGIVETANTIRSGRRAQAVQLARRTGLVAGVHIGRRELRVEITDLGFETQTAKSLPLSVDHRPDTTLDRAILLTNEMVESAGAKLSELQSLGVAITGWDGQTVNPRQTGGVLLDWQGVDVEEVVASRLNHEVVVVGEVEASATAQLRMGALKGVTDAMYLRLSEQVEAVMIVDGKLWKGRDFTGSELGHIRVDPTGFICACGARGCLNTVAGAQGILEAMRFDPRIKSLNDVVSLAKLGDPGCRQILSDAAGHIGTVVADQSIMWKPQSIIVGGLLSQVDDVITGPLVDSLKSRPLVPEDVSVQVAPLQGRSAVLGAALLAADASHEGVYDIPKAGAK